MKKNGAQIIHFATGMLVGYPPCPYISHFRDMIPAKYGLRVVVGTHPIPQKYFKIHMGLETWDTPEWKDLNQRTLTDEPTRLSYD